MRAFKHFISILAILLACSFPARAQSVTTVTGAGRVNSYSTLPATCSPTNHDAGQTLAYLYTGTTGLYYCSAANTWTIVGSGGGTSPGGSPAQYQINNTTFAGSPAL